MLQTAFFSGRVWGQGTSFPFTATFITLQPSTVIPECTEYEIQVQITPNSDDLPDMLVAVVVSQRILVNNLNYIKVGSNACGNANRTIFDGLNYGIKAIRSSVIVGNSGFKNIRNFDPAPFTNVQTAQNPYRTFQHHKIVHF